MLTKYKQEEEQELAGLEVEVKTFRRLSKNETLADIKSAWEYYERLNEEGKRKIRAYQIGRDGKQRSYLKQVYDALFRRSPSGVAGQCEKSMLMRLVWSAFIQSLDEAHLTEEERKSYLNADEDTNVGKRGT